jgi:hypothetical protein
MAIRNGLLFLVFFYAAAISADSTATSGPSPQDKSAFSTVKAGKFVFLYKADGQNLVGKVSYPTAGWVGVGFNPVKMMKGANFILGALAEGKAAVSDEFGTSNTSHAPDSTLGGKNNIVEGNVAVENGIMTLSFTIPLNSGDDKDAALEKGKPIRVIFAAGKKADIRKIHSDIDHAMITLQ